MDCPHCQSEKTRRIEKKTQLGYAQFYCRSCCTQYNERSGTLLNFITYPTEVVMMVTQYYYRFKVSLDDVVQLMLMRGFHLSHQTVYNWAHTFGTELGIQLRERRKGKCGQKWHIDATYLWVEGRWCYLYRAIDKEGNLVDIYLSDVRDQEAAEDFFLQAENTTGITPDHITTDKEPALYPAIDNVFGNCSKHRDSKYLNNRIEQFHRGIKSRCRVMKGFKDIFSSLRFCTVFEEIKQFFRTKNKSRAESRRIFISKFQKLNILAAKAF